MVFGFGRDWSAKGKHCFVTGGSQGLGLSLAALLAQQGAATVSIVARNVDKLQAAVEEIEKHRTSPTQVFRYHSQSLQNSTGASAAVSDECRALKEQTDGEKLVPDAFFLCAGAAYPRFFVEATEEQVIEGFNQAYWVQAWTAHSALRALASAPNPGAKIVFVGSTVSIMSFVGWATYAPGKYALRGLAETLRSEALLYDADVQIFYAPTMRSPGLEVESTTKPDITRKFEEGDACLESDEAAKAMLSGVERGDFHFGATLLQKVFINSSRGGAPNPNPILGPIFDCVSWIAIPFWRRDCDIAVRKHKAEHRKHLAKLGLGPSQTTQPAPLPTPDVSASKKSD